MSYNKYPEYKPLETQMEKELRALKEKQTALRQSTVDYQPSEPYTVSLGPQHPSTHGVFRCVATLDGEKIVHVENVMGYLHRGIEKIAESKTWAQFTPYTDRLDYLSPILSEWGYLLGVERLMNVEVPERGEYIRVILGELQRVANHLVFLASMALDFNGYTVWMYMFREREKILDLLEMYSGGRMNNNALRIGGVPTDLPKGFIPRLEKWMDEFPKNLKDFDEVINGNEIFIARTRNVGIIDAQTCKKLGIFGVNLRAAGFQYDLRKNKPYSIYDRFDFDVPVGKQGDCYDRFMVRYWEMEECLKILLQAVEGYKKMPADEPVMGKVPKMIRVPEGRTYAQIEGAKGWLGYYIVSDGGTKASRVRIHSPSFMSLTALPEVMPGELLQDLIAALASIDIVLGEVDR